MIHNALCRKLKYEQHGIHYKLGDFRSSGRTDSFYSTSGTRLVSLVLNPTTVENIFKLITIIPWFSSLLFAAILYQ